MSEIGGKMPAEKMWRLSDYMETIRQQVTPLMLQGCRRPLRFHLDFDVMVDAILVRLAVLRS